MTGFVGLRRRAILRAFLANFLVLEITREVAERAVLNRRQKRLKMPDAIILGTAEAAGRVLVTRNVKDFPSGMGGLGCLIEFKLLCASDRACGDLAVVRFTCAA
jgi:hypothetical protein